MLSSVFTGVFAGGTLNRKMTKPNQATAVLFISPSLTLWLLPPPCPWGSQGFMRSSWSLQPQKEEAGGAGYVEQGLELLRDVVALRCPAALQRGRF